VQYRSSTYLKDYNITYNSYLIIGRSGGVPRTSTEEGMVFRVSSEGGGYASNGAVEDTHTDKVTKLSPRV